MAAAHRSPSPLAASWRPRPARRCRCSAPCAAPTAQQLLRSSQLPTALWMHQWRTAAARQAALGWGPPLAPRPPLRLGPPPPPTAPPQPRPFTHGGRASRCAPALVLQRRRRLALQALPPVARRPAPLPTLLWAAACAAQTPLPRWRPWTRLAVPAPSSPAAGRCATPSTWWCAAAAAASCTQPTCSGALAVQGCQGTGCHEGGKQYALKLLW